MKEEDEGAEVEAMAAEGAVVTRALDLDEEVADERGDDAGEALADDDDDDDIVASVDLM